MGMATGGRFSDGIYVQLETSDERPWRFFVCHHRSRTLEVRRRITRKRIASRSARAFCLISFGDVPVRPGASAIGVSTAVLTCSAQETFR